MKRILLLTLSLFAIILTQAQKQKSTAYAITGVQKGNTKWTEVRLVDITTGEELQTIFQSANEAEILNARTGKPVVKRDVTDNAAKTVQFQTAQIPAPVAQIIKRDGNSNTVLIQKISSVPKQQYDQPFATNSAACAYDKKNERLYYTPMGINQLRYIDLKAKKPKVYYFEDEAFGVVKGTGDVQSQITRMVIGGDGNGYALSNDANHLIQFTVKKKPEIRDLGALTDDATNGSHSVHNTGNFGGDLIAAKNGDLYLIGANAAVYVFNPKTLVASYIGRIKGLPRGFSTNGAIAEGDSKVIVCSSSNTTGYYRFDLNTLEAEKVSNAATVFNASDLASATLAFEKKKKDPVEEKPIEEKKDVVNRNDNQQDVIVRNAISVYPNPVTNGYFKLSFSDQLPGRYHVQLMDIAGKVISQQPVSINSKLQIEEFKMPQKVAAGNYVVRVMNEATNAAVVHQLVVQ